MLALDLFNTRYEKELNEGAVDNLTARLLEPLSLRAAEIRTRLRNGKISPAEMKALEQEYTNLVAKRVDIIRGSAPAPQDECMGYGGLGETGPRPEDIPAYLRKQQGQAPLTPGQVKAPRPDTLSDPRNLEKARGEQNSLEGEELDEEGQYDIPPKYLYVIEQIRDGYESGRPYIEVTLPDNQTIPMDRSQMFNLLATFGKLQRKQIKKIMVRYFDNKHNMLSLLSSPVIKRYQTPPIPKPEQNPAQMGLPLDNPNKVAVEARGQKKNSKEVETPASQQVQRYLTKIRAASPNAVNDLEAMAQHELNTQAQVDKNITDLEKVNARQDATLKKAMTLDRQQDSDLNGIENQISQLWDRFQTIKSAKPKQSNGTTPAVNYKPTPAPEPTSVDVPQIVNIAEPEKLPEKDQEIYAQVKNLETELNNKISAMAKWDQVAQMDAKSRNELEALRKDTERTNKALQKKIISFNKQLGKQQSKDMGQVSQVEKTPTLAAPEAGDDIIQKISQANRRAKLGGTATNVIPAGAPGNQQDILHRLSSYSDQAQTVQARPKKTYQKTMGRQRTAQNQSSGATMHETTDDQVDQGAGKALSRSPEIRRLRQVQDYELMLKKELANRIQDRDNADEEQDFQDMNESNMKRMLSDLGDLSDADFLATYKRPKQYWRKQMSANPTPAVNISDIESDDLSQARTKPTFDRTGRMVKTRRTPAQQGMKRMLGTPKTVRPTPALEPVSVSLRVPNRQDGYDLLPAKIFNSEAEAREFARRVNATILDIRPVMDENFGRVGNISSKIQRGTLARHGLLGDVEVIKVANDSAYVKDRTGHKSRVGLMSLTPKYDQRRRANIEETTVNPQFINAQVTKILAGEARRMTNAPMAELLAPVMKEYGLSLPQIDSMVPGGLRKAAGEYGIMMKEGFQDFNKVEPYAVCLAGKPVKQFDYYEEARRFHDNWKQKLYREGDKAKADKITLMPLNLDEGIFFGPDNSPETGDKNIESVIKNLIALEFMAKNKEFDSTMFGFKIGESYFIKQIYSAIQNFEEKYNEKGKNLLQQIRNSIYPYLSQLHQGRNYSNKEFDNIVHFLFNNHKKIINDFQQISNLQIPTPKVKDIDVAEAGNPAQQAAIAIAIKKAGKKPKSVDEGADLINMSDLQFYKELLSVMIIPVAAFGAMAWHKAMNAIKLYRAEDVITALQKKGVTVDRSTLEQIKPLLLKLEQAIDVDKDGDVAKELAKRIQQTVTWGKLKQANTRTDAQPTNAELGEEFTNQSLRQNIPGKSVIEGFTIVYDRATKKVDILHQDQLLDSFKYTGAPTFGQFRVALENKLRQLRKDGKGPGKTKIAANRNYDQTFTSGLSHSVDLPLDVQKQMYQQHDQDTKDYGITSVANPGKWAAIRRAQAAKRDKETVAEDSSTSSEAVEIAIIRRILVAHVDLIMEFGLDKVTQAIEEVAYNVGDVDEIGTSDVSAYVHQVKQILGAE